MTEQSTDVAIINRVARASVSSASMTSAQDAHVVNGLIVALIWVARVVGIRDEDLIQKITWFQTEAKIGREYMEKTSVH